MNTIPELEDQHIRQLEEESAISREVIAERGVRTISRGRDLPKGFSQRQRRRSPGILFTGHRPNGETSYIFRPDAPDPERPGHKYEQPCKRLGGPGNTLDVHPSLHRLIDDVSAPVLFTEGCKKGDSFTTAARAAGLDVLTVAISGVWNWLSDGEPIPDMFDVPLEGRKAIIGFDSDMLRNPDVQDAARRLAEYLIDRGAEAWIIYLPDKPDGSKMGLDDFFAGGGTTAELRLLMRRYSPEDLTAERLKRGDLLRAKLEDLNRRLWATEWKGMGGHSSRDVYTVLVDLAPDRGKLHDDGLKIKVSRRELARMAKVSSRTLQKAIERLEEMGLIYRDTERHKAESAGAFVLSASVKQYGDGRPHTGETSTPSRLSAAGVLHLRSPRLRWSSPARKGRRGVVRGTRRVRRGPPSEPRPAVKRLGKIRGAVLDVLDTAGGSATVREICEAMHRSRPWDLRRRVLPMLEDARIIAVDGDTVTLAPDWLQRLEEARELGGEVRAERVERRRHKRQGKAFRRRLRIVPDPAPTEEEMRERRESRPRERREAIEAAIARLFMERPEYRGRRVGQIVCQLPSYLPGDFQRGQIGLPKDAEVEEILAGKGAA